MKVEHDKVPVDQFTPGIEYNMSLDGKPLYTALVKKFHGGCWATIVVTEVLDPAMANDYKPGMEFDIKVAAYDLRPKA